MHGFWHSRTHLLHTYDNSYKIIEQRPNDQFIQEWNSRALLSSKTNTELNTLFTRYETNTYLTVIKNPDKKKMCTRLRTDMNVLSTPCSWKKSNILVLLVTPNPKRHPILYIDATNFLSCGTILREYTF